jgi:hypothetical protein
MPFSSVNEAPTRFGLTFALSGAPPRMQSKRALPIGASALQRAVGRRFPHAHDLGEPLLLRGACCRYGRVREGCHSFRQTSSPLPIGTIKASTLLSFRAFWSIGSRVSRWLIALSATRMPPDTIRGMINS